MFATFCLRLACGLASASLVLPPVDVNPRFYRTQLLIVLGLTGAATFFLRETAGFWSWMALAASLFLAACGSLAWSLQRAPGGLTLIALTACSLAAALGISSVTSPLSSALSPFGEGSVWISTAWLLSDELSS